MKLSKPILFAIVVASCFFGNVFSQDSVGFRLEMFGSVATSHTTPFWIVNNTYGKVPLAANNMYLSEEFFWKHKFNEDFRMSINADLVTAGNHSSSFFVQQLYGEIEWQALCLSIGSKERYNSILDRRLSSGDFTYSTNARPIPEVNLSIPRYTKIPFFKEFLQFRGDFAVGKSIDNNYILDAKASDQGYTLDILWHHKSAYFLLEDPEKKFPFSVTFGFEHGVQWGGKTSFYYIEEMPHSLKDMVKVMLGKGGGEDAPDGEQINRLGNHVGTYNFKLNYAAHLFNVGVYKQHYFDDNSGMEYANWRDGIWGMECAFYNQNYLKKVVVEYVNTTNQSGPVHILNTDRPVRGGGNDDYYNNMLYPSGWSHFGRGLGNPLITSPEYNDDGVLHFKNNRIKALHLGFEGAIDKNISYRLLVTKTNAWGRMTYPFLEKKTDLSTMAEFNYTNPKWAGWDFGIQLAFDQGSLYNDNFGCSFKISKSGVIK